jgi:hypothetical protein
MTIPRLRVLAAVDPRRLTTIIQHLEATASFETLAGAAIDVAGHESSTRSRASRTGASYAIIGGADAT